MQRIVLFHKPHGLLSANYGRCQALRSVSGPVMSSHSWTLIRLRGAQAHTDPTHSLLPLDLLSEPWSLPHFSDFLHMEGYDSLCKCPRMLCCISLQIAACSKLRPVSYADPKTSECFHHLYQGAASGEIVDIFGFAEHMVSVASTQLCHKRWYKNKQVGLCANNTLPKKHTAGLRVTICRLPT